MNNDWFDEKTGLLTLDEEVEKSPSFKAIMADNVVTDEEIKAQSTLVLDLFHKAHDALTPEQRSVVKQLLVEMNVLHAVVQYREIADIRHATGI